MTGNTFHDFHRLMFNMASSRVEDEAFVTLATNDPYCYGALVLGQSLRDNGTTRQLAILVTPQVSQPMRQQLSTVYDVIRQVDPLDSQDEAHLALLTRPELGITFSKIHCWRLTQFKKCVFLDADTLVLQNVDELFDREELSAAPDVGWPDCFNSGVFVFQPSEETYNSLLQCAVTQGSFDGGDQGLLNTFFSGWATQDIHKHLPFIYNMTSNITYTYKPALLRFGKDIKIVHFIGSTKPWHYTFNTLTGTVTPPEGAGSGHGLSFVQAWWNVFLTSIKPTIEEAQGVGLASDIGNLKLNGSSSTMLKSQGSPRTRQHAWEQGEVDYMGMDKFDNIQKHIHDQINK